MQSENFLLNQHYFFLFFYFTKEALDDIWISAKRNLPVGQADLVFRETGQSNWQVSLSLNIFLQHLAFICFILHSIFCNTSLCLFQCSTTTPTMNIPHAHITIIYYLPLYFFIYSPVNVWRWAWGHSIQSGSSPLSPCIFQVTLVFWCEKRPTTFWRKHGSICVGLTRYFFLGCW